jgi:NAD-dependent deacetylase
MIEEQVQELQTDLQNARHVVFLTGAGVSTHSGIPDYRSKNGIYNGISQSPEEILSTDTLMNRPALFHDFVMKNMYFPQAKPNLIHEKIAQICQDKGQLVTQNVDGLDRKAGNKSVIEFHGNLYDIYCTKCGQKVAYEEYKNSYLHQADSGIIRPGIVLYGEPIDQEKLMKSVQAVANSDLVIICGTSFVVYPFAGLLQYASGAKIWAINKQALAQVGGINQIVADAAVIFKQLR